MAKEEKSLGLGEISTIRDILMGQQIAEYDKRFKEVADDADSREKEINNRIQNLEKDISSRLDALEKDMSARFDKLEKLLADNISSLDNKLNDVSRNDKEILGQMLQDMGKKLLNGKAK